MALPRRDAVRVHHQLRCLFRLLLAPNAQDRERPRKQREGADRDTRINLGDMPEYKSMSGGACTERKTQHHECVLQKVFRHVQILSGDSPKDTGSSKTGAA